MLNTNICVKNKKACAKYMDMREDAYISQTCITFKFIFFLFLRMLAPEILAEIMQHAKLALHTEIINVCVLLDLDLKATIVIKVRYPLNFFCSQ